MSTDRRDPVTAFNPATGETLGSYECATPADLAQRIQEARRAFPAWSSTPLKTRIRYVRQLRDYLTEHADELAEAISRNNGKTRVEALATEIAPAVMAVDYYCRKARQFLKPVPCGTGNILFMYKRSKVVRTPYGVVGIITAWNYPFAIPLSEVVMAVLAGNTVIVKPADETPLVVQKLQECVASCGLPAGVVSVMLMPGPGTGETMLECGVDKLFFTGSGKVGSKLMAKAAETLTPVVLELGGNDAMIVCEDADLERAAGGVVWAGFQNAGQSCGGVERVYVHDAVADEFLAILKRRVEALRIGPDRDHEVDVGSMTVDRQVDTVRRHVSDALDKGAVVFAQCVPRNDGTGRLLPAMVLTNVHHDMRVMKEESFGPVVGVMKYSSEEEAIRLANDSSLGLTGSVWTTSRRRGERLARQIRAGVVTINDHLMSHGLAETPWGGFKQSGIGRTHGRLGFDEMTQPQTIVHDVLPFVRKDLWWPPYGPKVYEGLRGFVMFFYGRGIFKRLTGLVALLRIFPRIFSK